MLESVLVLAEYLLICMESYGRLMVWTVSMFLTTFDIS